MHVHAESVQGCAIRVRGSVWHPLYVHYCTSDRYLLAPVSLSRAERILRSTGSAHALVHTLASRWTPSRLTLVRSPLSVLLARLGYRRTHEKENEISFPLFSFSSSSSFFFFLFLSILYFCVYLCRSRPREVERRRGGARHEGGGIYFCNEILPLRSIGNCTWTVHAHSPRVDSLRVRLGDKDSNRVKFIFTKKCSLIFTFKLAEFARKNLSFVFSIFDEMVNLDWSEWIVR